MQVCDIAAMTEERTPICRAVLKTAEVGILV